MLNTGAEKIETKTGLLTTLACSLDENPFTHWRAVYLLQVLPFNGSETVLRLLRAHRKRKK